MSFLIKEGDNLNNYNIYNIIVINKFIVQKKTILEICT